MIAINAKSIKAFFIFLFLFVRDSKFKVHLKKVQAVSLSPLNAIISKVKDVCCDNQTYAIHIFFVYAEFQVNLLAIVKFPTFLDITKWSHIP